jgi:hypothetical protein
MHVLLSHKHVPVVSCVFVCVGGGATFLVGINGIYVSGHVMLYGHSENAIADISYEMSCMIKVNYYVSMLKIGMNGLRDIRGAKDTQEILIFVDIGHHFIPLYFERNESMRAIN